MRKIIFLLILNLYFSSTFSLAQNFADILGTSHYSRVIRLGNTYTSVAEGTEALFYNVAGLANTNMYGVLFSSGQGFAFFVEDVKAYDYAIISSLPNNFGNIGLSINSLSYKGFYNDEQDENIYSLSYARNIINGLSVGLKINYYSYKSTETHIGTQLQPSISGSVIDLNFGTLYEFPNSVKISDNDKFRIGIQIKNFLGSKIKFSNVYGDEYLFQDFRLGISYKYILDYFYGLEPLKLLFTFDAIYTGSNYDFNMLHPNFGIELSLLDILEISFGRENEELLNDNNENYYSPQHPVNRYGLGLNIPLDYLLSLSYKVNLKIDFSISDWQKINEENVQSDFFSIRKIDDNTFSVGLTFKP